VVRQWFEFCSSGVQSGGSPSGSRVVHAGSERAGAGFSLEEEQHVAHVIPEFAADDFVLVRFFETAARFVNGSLPAIMLARLCNSSASWLMVAVGSNP
jgi:hypothetical protein